MYRYYKGNIKIIKESKGIINYGIIYEAENKLIYMAHTIQKQFSIYDIKNENNPILIKTIENEYVIDNLFMKKTSGIIYAENYMIFPKLQIIIENMGLGEFRYVWRISNY